MWVAISKNKLLNSLEWGLYLVLSLVSIWFAYGVLDNFFTGKTSFALHEEPVTDHPVISIVFTHQISPSEVEIYYDPNSDLGQKPDYDKLEIGENSVQNQTVILESYWFNAYRYDTCQKRCFSHLESAILLAQIQLYF